MPNKEERINKYTKRLKSMHKRVNKELLDSIVLYLGPNVYKKDAELIAYSDKKELETVKRNFLIKKLKLERYKEEELDKALIDVGKMFPQNTRKHRAIVYYLLTIHFKKQSTF